MGNGATSKAYNGVLQDSLRTIKRAHKQLHVVTKTAATPTALMSRMELYGVLLGEVAGIRSNLVAYLECARAEGKFRCKWNALTATRFKRSRRCERCRLVG